MSLARRYPLATFLLVTYVLTAVIFALPLLGSTGIGLVPIELPGILPFVLVSALGLTAVAFFVTRVAEGRDSVRDLRGRAFSFRVSPVWYLVALLLLPLAALATA